MHRGCFLTCLALAVIGSPTWAGAQTIYGPGGLFVHPTAFTAHRGATGMNVTWFTQERNGGPRTEWLPVALTHAFTSQDEAGVLFIDRRTPSGHTSSGGAFFKHQFLQDSDSRPAVAIAASYIGGDIQLSSLSGILSHRLAQTGKQGITVHLGAQWVRRADIPVTQDDFAAFVGAELPLSREFRLVGDVGTRLKFDRSATSGVGIIWSSPHGFNLGIGYVNAGRGDNNRFFIGIGYPIGAN